MSESKKQKLESLRKNYQEVKGQPFDHFFCPILLRDQDASLCKAHIINQAFSESTPDWTIQREDVDNFYGRVVESEFVKLDYDQTDITAEALVDSELSKKLQPKIKVGGNEVEHFILDDELPSGCTAVEYEHEDQSVQLGLKIPPKKFVNEMNNVNIEINLDVRVHAFVSLLKSAHLFMFDLLGYKYIFRKTGQFLGKILQDFFIQNKDNSNEEARKNAENSFRDYFALVRPLHKESSVPPDTIDNHHFHLVWIEDTNKIWGKIIYFHTGDMYHAVLLPVLNSQQSESRFRQFLDCPDGKLLLSDMLYKKDSWEVSNDRFSVFWPPIDDPIESQTGEIKPI